MQVIIDGYGLVSASPLDVVRLVASALGIQDVDVEYGVGARCEIRSSAATAKGANEAEACTIFLNRVFSRGTVAS